MNKTRKRIDLAQNAAIFLLTLSALFFFSQTSFFTELSRTSLVQRIQTTFSAADYAANSTGTALSSLSIPLRIVQTNEFACYGADALTTSSEEFERVGSFLGEAIGSSHSLETVDRTVFMQAVGASGLYFDFSSALPLEILAARLGVNADTTQSLDIRHCLLSVGAEQTALLYLYTASDTCLRYQTAVNAAALQSYLDTITGNETSFAFTREEEYGALSPLTLLLGTPNMRHELSSTNVLNDYSTEELLRRAEFNPHTKDYYTESNGTVVVLEAQRMLRLEPDGTILYSGNSMEDASSLYHVATANGEVPSRLEAANAAQTLLSELLRERLGDALIYLREMETTVGGYRLCFDYMVNGTPVLFSDGSCAAEVFIEGDAITAFSLKLRRYTLTEPECLLLPLPQAAAIGSLYDGNELTVAYIDTFNDTTHAEWVCQ